ncbi:MAG TPA: MFS transporter [Kofleriaceae bacterium]|nr:MFS transporter [Kofleriaceae bacterium]
MARDLRLFYLFRLLATSYLWMPISVTFMMAGRGLGWTEVMWLSAIYCGVVILVEVPTGALADRIGRRESMMAGCLAMVVSCLVAWHAESFAGFAVVQATAALSMSLCSGADSAYLFDLLQSHGRADEYPVREGTASAWHLAGHALAFAAGGALGEIDLVLPYLVTAGVAGAAFVVALFLRDEGINAPAPEEPRPVGEELRAYASVMGRALGDLFRNRRLLWIMGYSAVAFTLLKVTIDLYQPYLDSRGFSLTGRGLVFAGIHVLAALVATRAIALRRRFGEEALVWGVMGMLAASFLLLVQVSGALVLVLLAVQAVASGLYSPLVKPMINREIRESGRRATVLSIESIMRRAAMGLFLLAAGLLGSTSAIYLCGAVGLAGGIVLWLTARPAGASPRTEPGKAARQTTQTPLEARD